MLLLVNYPGKIKGTFSRPFTSSLLFRFFEKNLIVAFPCHMDRLFLKPGLNEPVLFQHSFRPQVLLCAPGFQDFYAIVISPEKAYNFFKITTRRETHYELSNQ